jgi:hypothetical protein
VNHGLEDERTRLAKFSDTKQKIFTKRFRTYSPLLTAPNGHLDGVLEINEFPEANKILLLQRSQFMVPTDECDVIDNLHSKLSRGVLNV